MKVLLINGSPNVNGCTYTALKEVADTLEKEGVEAEIIHVGNKDIRGCIGCRQCKKNGKCVFNDLVNEVAPKFEEADGIVLGSPVYYGSPNGGAISFIDRLFYSTPFDKKFKVGAAVTSARRAGTTASFDVLNKYFTISEMPIVSTKYWNMVHGYTPDDVRQDVEGMINMRILGRNMAFMIKAIKLAKETYGLPETEPHVFTSFIR